MSARDARRAAAIAEITRDWQLVTLHLARAGSVADKLTNNVAALERAVAGTEPNVRALVRALA